MFPQQCLSHLVEVQFTNMTHRKETNTTHVKRKNN